MAFIVATGCIGVEEQPRAAPPPIARTATAPSNGYNDEIAWRHLKEGLAESKETGWPMMLVVHASWCPRCKELKPAFQDKRLQELSNRFVMVNADQDKVPQVQAYGPDGVYLPRVLVLDPATGRPDTAFQNQGRERYHYYWGPNDDLAGMMQKALVRYGKS